MQFDPAQGSMSVNSTVTGYGGFVTSTQSGGALGNTITVSAPGLPPVTVYTAIAPVAGSHNDNGVAWYDVECAVPPDIKNPVHLFFHAVDGMAKVWIDGEFVHGLNAHRIEELLK